ncbi:MAG: hypothetical protein IJ412_06915 [Oscillospiraceae bacterium]|nr:hypothetical protein [Oscillospiraceae bacterium]
MSEITKLSELAVYLKYAVATYSQHDYEQLHQELRARYEQQIMEAFMDHHPGWSVVEGNTACMMYLYRNWVFAKKEEEENAAQLVDLADDLIENYEDCEEEFLTAETVVKTMCIADQIYDFSQRILKDQHLFIFMFQAKHEKEDSFCRCMTTSDSSVAADIYMLVSHKDLEATPQSMLLHELGHYVNIALTGNPEIPPEDFALVTSLIGVNYDNCDVTEFFAHCFAMSLLNEPELLNVNPFKTVPLNHKQMFRTYFQYKIQNL